MEREKIYGLTGLIAAAVLGLVLRLFAGKNALVGGEVLFDGFDTYYHMRRILYTVNHFPNTLWFDSYLDYPRGMELTWPPLFDQLIGGLSLALGAHTQSSIEMVSALVPVFLGMLAVVVVYFMAREIFDPRMALLSAFAVAIAPYHILRTMFSAVDHHALEALLLVTILTFLVFALSRKEQGYAFAAAAGLSMAALAYTWAGTGAYLSIFLIYALVQMTVDIKNSVSSRDSVSYLLVAFGSALILMAPFWNKPWMMPTFLATSAMVVSLVVLYGLSKVLLYQGAHWVFFPLAIFALGYSFMLLPHFLGQLWIFSDLDSLVRSGGEYLLGGDMVGRIAEAEPLYSRPELLTTFMGWNLLYYIVGLIALGAYILRGGQPEGKRQGLMLLMVWAVSALVLTIGQIRFLYISSIGNAIMIAILFFEAVHLAESRLVPSIKTKLALGSEGRSQQIRVAAIALLLIFLLLPSALDTLFISNDKPQITGDWYNSLCWLEENSNATSFYDDPSKQPEYSVMSWWDYGNWILYQSKRPVVANNFQTGVIDSASFYLSQDEDQALSILKAHNSRYILTEFDMLYGKLPAITIWLGEDPSSYQQVLDYGGSLAAVPLKKLMNTVLAKIYFTDGSYLGHFRLIHESETLKGKNPPISIVKISEYVPGALITGTAAPDQPVGVLLNLTSNLGREFRYVNIGVPIDGRYELRVPYSTERPYETHAIASYLVFSGNRYEKLNVSERDVLEGRSLEVNF
jgi:oligosaccharyl transferase (archaeosortase A-associated)